MKPRHERYRRGQHQQRQSCDRRCVTRDPMRRASENGTCRVVRLTASSSRRIVSVRTHTPAASAGARATRLTYASAIASPAAGFRRLPGTRMVVAGGPTADNRAPLEHVRRGQRPPSACESKESAQDAHRPIMASRERRALSARFSRCGARRPWHHSQVPPPPKRARPLGPEHRADIVVGYWEHYNRVAAGKANSTKAFWAYLAVEDAIERRADDLVELLVELASSARGDEAAAYLGAGPIETIVKHRGAAVGRRYAKALRAAAVDNENLRRALSAVW